MARHTSLPTNSTIDGLTLSTNPDGRIVINPSALRHTHLPAEWAPQSAVQLTWPHAATDWADCLPQVTACYIRMAYQIASRQTLLVVTPHKAHTEATLRQHLPAQALARVRIYEMPTNDTWARDHGFLTLLAPSGPQLLDFRFNGWGLKFEAEEDNRINARLYAAGALQGQYQSHLNFVLEGGSIENDGCGTILTTSQCLLNSNRNPGLTKDDIEQRLKDSLHASRILWLDYGHLEGDDTDSHIDTLARFCPADTIAYVQCTDKADSHYANLSQMEAQLHTFRTTEGKPYRLLPLPMAAPMHDGEGNRLPATYANFLVINHAVLMPTYGTPALDEQAKKQLAQAFPRHEIIGIDCRILVEQHGSLHCSTMQFPVPACKP